MISYNYLLPLLFLIVLIILVALFILLGRLTYRVNEKTNFSFRNRFPFELYYQRNVSVVSYFRLVLIILVGFLIAINALFISSFREGANNIAYATFISVFYTLASVCALVLFLVRPNFLKQFKLYVILLFAFLMMANAMLAIISLTDVFMHFSHKIIAGFAFVLVAIDFALAINPKLKRWDRLDEVNNQNGTVSYVRPKISPLAFSLWLNYLTLVIGESLLLVTMILNSFGY